ncbi:MAG: hypothetical protein ACRBCJ_05020 [Hyphomicrobiaceae bacterium]
MSNIIKFELKQRTSRDASVSNSKIELGEILIFPGVRYERDCEQTAADMQTMNVVTPNTTVGNH